MGFCRPPRSGCARTQAPPTRPRPAVRARARVRAFWDAAPSARTRHAPSRGARSSRRRGSYIYPSARTALVGRAHRRARARPRHARATARATAAAPRGDAAATRGLAARSSVARGGGAPRAGAARVTGRAWLRSVRCRCGARARRRSVTEPPRVARARRLRGIGAFARTEARTRAGRGSAGEFAAACGRAPAGTA